jgi:outer membrane protein assembly factor BamB
VLGLSLAEGFVFAQTNKGYFHAIDAETGQILWATRLGLQTGRVRAPSVNSFGVYVSNLNILFALDRRTGRAYWQKELNAIPSSPTAANEDLVMVGEATGKLHGFSLKVKTANAEQIAGQPVEAWNWQTAGSVETRPLPAGRFVVFGSDDGKVYVATADERTMLYRFATGGAIGAGFGTLGTRTLLVPSADRNLYALDLMTTRVLWSYPSGAPIQQAPLVAGNDIFAVNTAGLLTSVDPNSGTARWTTSTQGGRLLSIGEKRIYLESHDEDLFIVDRATGKTIADPRATFERVGLNLRCYEFGPTNRFNDRLYFATPAGIVIALREIGRVNPLPLRDPKALPFGYIPSEGVSLTPPPPPPAEPAPPAAEGAVPPPAEGANPPAPGAEGGAAPKEAEPPK